MCVAVLLKLIGGSSGKEWAIGQEWKSRCFPAVMCLRVRVCVWVHELAPKVNTCVYVLHEQQRDMYVTVDHALLFVDGVKLSSASLSLSLSLHCGE